jgi:hypothetical protein
MLSFSALSIFALISTGLSSPIVEAKAARTPTAGEGTIQPDLGTAVGGAMVVQTNAPLIVDIASPPQYLTITVINSHGDAISTSHAHAANGPSAVSGNVGPGTMANGATAAFALPTGWSGNVAINDAGFEITGDDSLIEASFVVPVDYSVAVADVDVSYV